MDLCLDDSIVLVFIFVDIVNFFVFVVVVVYGNFNELFERMCFGFWCYDICLSVDIDMFLIFGFIGGGGVIELQGLLLLM